MQFQLNDFCLRYNDLDGDKPLPLEKIEGLDLQTATTRNRFGIATNSLVRDLLEITTQYAPVVWDELAILDKKISFYTECLENPDNFRFVRGKGIIKILSTEKGEIQEEGNSWVTSSYDISKTEPLNDARLTQISNHLDKFEHTHDFLIEVIHFIK